MISQWMQEGSHYSDCKNNQVRLIVFVDDQWQYKTCNEFGCRIIAAATVEEIVATQNTKNKTVVVCSSCSRSQQTPAACCSTTPQISITRVVFPIAELLSARAGRCRKRKLITIWASLLLLLQLSIFFPVSGSFVGGLQRDEPPSGTEIINEFLLGGLQPEEPPSGTEMIINEFWSLGGLQPEEPPSGKEMIVNEFWSLGGLQPEEPPSGTKIMKSNEFPLPMVGTREESCTPCRWTCFHASSSFFNERWSS